MCLNKKYNYIGHLWQDKYFLKLVDRGLDVNEINANSVIKHLSSERKNAPKVYSHTNLGFRYYNNNLYFNHFKMTVENKDKAIEYAYDGEILIKPKDDHKVWLDMIKNSVIGHTEIELAICLSRARTV